jgi:hypothetical protein
MPIPMSSPDLTDAELAAHACFAFPASQSTIAA